MSFMQVRGRKVTVFTGAESWRQRRSEWDWCTTSVATERNGGGFGKAHRTAGCTSSDPYFKRTDCHAETLRDRFHRKYCHAYTLLQGRSHVRQQPENTSNNDITGSNDVRVFRDNCPISVHLTVLFLSLLFLTLSEWSDHQVWQTAYFSFHRPCTRGSHQTTPRFWKTSRVWLWTVSTLLLSVPLQNERFYGIPLET